MKNNNLLEEMINSEELRYKIKRRLGIKGYTDADLKEKERKSNELDHRWNMIQKMKFDKGL